MKPSLMLGMIGCAVMVWLIQAQTQGTEGAKQLVVALPNPAFMQQRAVPPGTVDAQAQRFDPTSVYKQESIQGFTILINAAVLKHPAAARAVRRELALQLAAIARVVPAKVMSTLRTVRIWVEWEAQPSAATFHPSAVWLSENGYNPEKAGCVEVSHTRNFVRWSHTTQPWMMLHELAHAYHHLRLGGMDAGIQTAYQNAVKQRLYESVTYILGGQQKAYALTNHKEYFAELSEAYFGKNDFYPFTRTQLKTYDPMGYQLMQRAWGKLSTADRSHEAK